MSFESIAQTGAKIFVSGAIGSAVAGLGAVAYAAAQESTDCRNLYTMVGVTANLPLILATGFVAGATIKTLQATLCSGKIGATLGWVTKP